MGEIAQIITAFGAAPAMLTGLFLVWQIFKTEPGKALANKLLNGKEKNGVAGQATVDFWKNANRAIFREEIDVHDRDAERRHETLEKSLGRLEALHTQSIEVIRTGHDRIVDALTSLSFKLPRN